MDYRDIVFIKVAEYLNLSKAADELHISQPAVTKHIKEIEIRYNTNLLERRGNKIYLTNSGKILYSALKNIEQQYRNLEFEIGELNSTLSGEFVIGASTTIAQYVIPKVIASFHKRYPDIKINLLSGNSFEMEQMLLENQIDVALIENETSRAGLKYKNFMQDELIIVTGSKSVYAKRKSFTLEEFAIIPVVDREHGSGTLEVIKRAMEKRGSDFENLNAVIQLGSTESIKNFLLEFDGVAIISQQAVKNEIYMNVLKRLYLQGATFPRFFRLALRIGNESRQVGLFESFLLSYNF
jgi:DNA-binding transcriptional LysR family regulator